MLMVALAFVLVPLLRPRPTTASPITDESSNITIFRAHKRELDDDLARGLITAVERDLAVAELGTRVVAEVPEPVSSPRPTDSSSEKHSWIVAMCLAMLIPVGAILAYLALGTPQAIGVTKIAAVSSAGPADANAEPPLSDKQIVAMVDSLAKKMNEQPGDPKGWILLARSQNALGRYPEAAEAYERAMTLLPGDAQVLADYADVLVMTQEGRFDGKPYQLIQQALKLDGNNLKVLALAGTAEMRLGNRAGSLKHWQKLKTLVAKDSNDYREVEAIIAEVSGKPATRVPPQAVQPPASVANVSSTVSGSVTIAPELTAKIAPGDILFVLARAAGAVGANTPTPRMPLAVLRIPAPQTWPYLFSLTDAMAMAPGMNLSSFPEVVIEARISKSGGATLQPGDLTGLTAPIKPGTKNLAVTISRTVP